MEAIAEPLIYYSRVTLEVLKLVAQHQKISIPTPGHFAEAQGALGSFFSATQNGAWKAITLAQVGRGLLETVKIGGFFYVGEMIGRRSLVGYDIEGYTYCVYLGTR